MNTGRDASPDPAPPRGPWALLPGTPIWIGGLALEARSAAERYLVGAQRTNQGPIEHLFIAPATTDEMLYFYEKHSGRLAGDGMIWIVAPAALALSETTARLAAGGWTCALSVPFEDRFQLYGFRRRGQGD